jgi:site-specific recombinase XerD
MPTEMDAISREHIESFITAVLAHHKPSTANQRYRSIQQFFNWLLEAGEIIVHPMKNMKPPRIPEEQLKRLLRACEGKDFAARRDMAIIRLLLDIGMRRGELVGLTLGDIDFEQNVAIVLGKGRRPRACPFGKRTARDLDRYLRVRAKHPDADLPNLWLGRSGPMTDSGIYQVVRDRARQAGIEGTHPHLFRHGFAHAWLAQGGQEGDLTADRLAIPDDAGTLWRQRGRRTGAGGT